MLMKLHSCSMEDNPSLTNTKGDNSREINICVEQGCLCGLTYTSSYIYTEHKKSTCPTIPTSDFRRSGNFDICNAFSHRL